MSNAPAQHRPLSPAAPAKPLIGLAPTPARQRVVWFAVAMAVMVGGLMVGALTLHTRIAERQLHIDRLERSLREAQTDFDILRSERAELGAPARLAARAGELGMAPGAEGEFLTVEPMTLAIALASTGTLPFDPEASSRITTQMEPLERFLIVKSAIAEMP